RKRGRKPKVNKGRRLTDYDREAMWNAPPSFSDHIPGKLSLCVGLPVIIRHNYATELCMTKGQEGIVRGWDSYKGPHGKMCLETLYVKLLNPPQDINIPGLETNIVPVPKMGTPVTCQMPDDSTIRVHRTQVVVLPNFAMTDYSSQGKTRPFNVVELGNCRTAQSFYTCLSRSSTAEGTVIVQGLTERKITKGISGYLRQEFRDVKGSLRKVVIKNYQQWKGDACESSDWHPALKWSATESKMLEEVSDGTWDETLNAGIAVSKAVDERKKRKV
ncbi:hypothetical protein CPC08DRAFT_601496, partial [Agrocybe pediades]